MNANSSSTPPQAYQGNQAIPAELTSINRWVCWRLIPDKDGKDKKMPFNPSTGKLASTKDPSTWSDYATALAALSRYSYSGIGFVFSRSDDITGVDIDHCYDPNTGVLSDIASAIMAHCQTYAEFSPSGTGVHLYYHGAKPAGACRKTTAGVEMYDDGRFFTVTGNPVPAQPGVFGSQPTIASSPETLEWIHETYIASKRAKGKAVQKHSDDLPEAAPLSDDDVLTRARLAKNGELFQLLYAGDWQNPALKNPDQPSEPRYGSQSEADQALANLLAFWTRKNTEQIDRLFRASGLMRAKWDEKHHGNERTYGEETIVRACDFTSDTYDPSDAPIFEADGRYYRTRGDATYQITNFRFEPVEMVVSEDETQLTADLVTVTGEVFQLSFLTTDFANLQKFKNIVNKRTISMTYTGSEGDLELLKGFLATLKWTVKRGVKASGIYQHEGRLVFVEGTEAIEHSGELVPSIVQLEKYQSIQSDILRTNVLSPERFAEIAKYLLSYNEPAKTVSVIAWSAACFLKNHLRSYSVKFPHLFLIGEAGSGKSNTLERIILAIFSRVRVVAAGQVTVFTLMKDSASSNTVPQALDEFKPSKIDKMRLNALYNHFRDSYDGHEGQRGRADQSTVYYELLAPLIVAGEESADEAAVRERSIELLFSKKDLKSLEHRQAFRKLEHDREGLQDLGRSLLDTALALDPATAYAWYEEALGTFNQDLPSRVISNLACCAAGLKLLEKLVDGLGLSWDLVFLYSFDTCRKYLEFAAETYLLDGGTSNQSIVEQTFEIIARMKPNPASDFILSDDHKTLYLALGALYDEYTKYRKDHAIVGEVLNYKQFQKQLKFSDMFFEGSVQKRMGDRNVRMCAINYEILKARCDVAYFEDPLLVKGGNS